MPPYSRRFKMYGAIIPRIAAIPIQVLITFGQSFGQNVVLAPSGFDFDRSARDSLGAGRLKEGK